MIQRSLLRSSRALNSRLPQPTSFTSLRQSSPFCRLPSTKSPISQIGLRLYSEAAETKKEDVPAPKEKPAAPATPSAEEALKKELEAKSKEVVELKDKYLRSVADFRNLQDRTKREIQAAKDFALQKFAKDLVDSVDNLDRALTTVPAAKLIPGPPSETEHANHDLVLLHDGLKMTERILMQTLEKHGLKRFDPAVEGDKFDPNMHEAVFMTPQPDKEDGTVFHTQRKGFLLNNRVLRAAQVGVVKNS